MDEDDLYDEFGNYIGDVEDSDDEDDVQQQPLGVDYVDDDNEEDANGSMEVDQVPEEPPANAVVLHEDKQYYPSANQVFGEDVEVMVQDQDAQPITQPIVEPDVVKKFTFELEDLPKVAYKREFQMSLMQLPEQIRNVAFVGDLHHGKTALLDMLIKQTHDISDFTGKMANEQLRYTDIHVLERERGISIMNSPISLVLENRKCKSHLFNILDTPGHVNFVDEVVAGGRLVDGFMVVVDVVEGLGVNAQQIIKHALAQNIPFVLVINKVDRLIMELTIPPKDAYAKLVYCIEQVNDYIRQVRPSSPVRLSPELGNVIFASAKMEWCFSVLSFADLYTRKFPSLEPKEFSKRLWGDIYFNSETRKFTKKKQGKVANHSFVHFVLEPLYKLHSTTISRSTEELQHVLTSLGIQLKRSAFKMDVKPLLKLVCKEFFGEATAFVDCCLEYLPGPTQAARSKVEQSYSGPIDDSPVVTSMLECNQEGPMAVQITKLYSSQDATEFYALGRVMSGTLKRDQKVKLLGETFTIDDHEDSYDEKIEGLWVPMTKYKIPVDQIPAGCWALIKGIDTKISKTATLVDQGCDLDETFGFKPLKCMSDPFVKVAVEPLNPSELPKMLDGLRKVTKSYVLLKNIVEDSGEHTIFGSGELYMDCVLHDLRKLYADIEIRVSDPMTKFSETVTAQSSQPCFVSSTAGRHNKMWMFCEPFDDGISQDIENHVVDIHWPVRKVGQFFHDRYNWNLMDARNIWAFGPGDDGANILVNSTIPGEVDKSRLNAVRDHVRAGFQWACKDGPLCGEPIRNTTFKLNQITLADKPIQRSGGAIIPTARRACNASVLLSGAMLLEPLYTVHVTCKDQAVDHVYNLLQRRRGHVIQDSAIPGTPLSYVFGEIPVIDSFGFETDLRLATTGDASVSLVFDRWQQVPGDPLDADQKTQPLQAARPSALARDFVLKTRRRKGLSYEPKLEDYIDEDSLELP